MSYLQDFVYYPSGTEVPEEYVWWSGLSLLGHILGNKVWIQHGDYFKFYPNLFVCLVGDAGSGKNTGLAMNMEIMDKEFPDLMLSASIQSREDISFLMGTDACAITWQDTTGVLGTPGECYFYRPFYILNNELASFLSVDKLRMAAFLVEVFDGKRFSTGFKGDRKENPKHIQVFHNPHVSLIAGAVPEWFMSTLKIDLFSGGLGRRLIIVNAKRHKIMPRPMKPQGADAAIKRVIEYLHKARYIYGKVELDKNATVWWDKWYMATRNKPPEDVILAQFHSTQHMQLLKIALLLAKAKDIEAKWVTQDELEASLSLLEQLQEPIVRLTSGVGRNELAGVGAEIEMAVAAAGIRGVTKKRILATFFRQIPGGMRALDMEVLPFLQKTDKIVAVGPAGKPDEAVLFTPIHYEAYMKQNQR